MSAKRFIVIEPSIKDESGHYLQYALHVLRAAADCGFAQALACHRQFAVSPPDGVEVYPAFTNTFWHRYGAAAQYRTRVSKAIHEFTRVKNGLSLRFQANWYFSKTYVAVATVTGAAIKPLPVKVVLGILLLPLYILWRITKMARVQGFKGWIYRKLAGTSDQLYARSTAICISQMTDDFEFLHATAKLTSDDHLLLATVSGAELKSLLAALERNPALAKATWHLVFRRNLRPHPEGEFPKDLEPDLVREGLDKFKEMRPNVRLYTDTDALSAEYDEFAGEKLFGTLPIPHVRPPSGQRPTNGPLVVSYLGDARPEKGFQHLSRIAEAVRISLLETGRIRFRVQANFNTVDGEPDCVVSRKLLERHPSSQVELMTEAQSEEDHFRNIAESGLVLIPYDVNSYAERSSGIFAECAAMEVPSVVPSGTWMSRHVRLAEYKELAKAFAAGKKPAEGTVQRIPSGTAGVQYNPVETRWFHPGAQPRFNLAATRPTEAGQALLKLVIEGRWYARLRCIQRDADGVLLSTGDVLLEAQSRDVRTETFHLENLLPQTRSLQFELHNVSASELNPDTLDLVFIDQAKPVEHYGPGEVYFDWMDVPAILEKVACNRERYREPCAQFGSQMRDFHSGPSFMRRLGIEVTS